MTIRPGDMSAVPSERRLVSVTTIISALDKPALPAWAAKATARAAVENAGDLSRRVAQEGESSVVDWLAGARFRPAPGRRTAADLGTAFHAAAERFALTGERPSGEVDGADVESLFGPFESWWSTFKPRVVATELTVFNETQGYAGTCDLIAEVAGRRYLIDYKVRSASFDRRGDPVRPYPEVALQLSAYRHAEFCVEGEPRRSERGRRRQYLLGQPERQMAAPMPAVEAGVAIVVTPDHCTAYEVECGPAVFEAFRHLVAVSQWATEGSRRVIGRAFIAPRGGEGRALAS